MHSILIWNAAYKSVNSLSSTRILTNIIYNISYFIFIARGNELADISADFWHIYLFLMTNQRIMVDKREKKQK